MSKTILFLFSLFLLSCEKTVEPKLPFSMEKAVKVLADIQVAEASFQFANKNDIDSLATQYYDEVFKLNHIKKEEFDTMIHVLMNNPALADTLYEKVLLELRRQEKIVSPEKAKKDVVKTK